MGAAQSAKDTRCFFSRTEDGMWDHHETNIGLCLLADGTFELVWGQQWQLPDTSPIATIETVDQFQLKLVDQSIERGYVIQICSKHY